MEYKEDIQIFGMNMTFISSSEVKKVYFTNEMYAFELHKNIQIFGMNMTFISSSEVKELYFMSGEATIEMYVFSLHKMK